MASTIFSVILLLLALVAFLYGRHLRRAGRKQAVPDSRGEAATTGRARAGDLDASDDGVEDVDADDSDDLDSGASPARGFLHAARPEAPSTRARARLAYLVSAACATLAVIVLAVASSVVVPTKEIGVVTTFGKPTGSLSNGFHLKAPWQKVTYMDAAIQTDSHTADDKSCINVRIAHQATACVDASIRWRIRPDASDALFQNYREFSSIRSSLVDRQLSSSLNKEFASYDALAVDEKGNPTTPTLAKLSDDATKDMRDQIGDQIEVLSVIIPVIKLDDNTQSKANALLAQVAQTRIAEQGVKTAEQQAKANEALAKSVSKDPNVLVSKCLDMVEGGKVTLPAGFSCWPSSGSAVVVPSTGSSSK